MTTFGLTCHHCRHYHRHYHVIKRHCTGFAPLQIFHHAVITTVTATHYRPPSLACHRCCASMFEQRFHSLALTRWMSRRWRAVLSSSSSSASFTSSQSSRRSPLMYLSSNWDSVRALRASPSFLKETTQRKQKKRTSGRSKKHKISTPFVSIVLSHFRVKSHKSNERFRFHSKVLKNCFKTIFFRSFGA